MHRGKLVDKWSKNELKPGSSPVRTHFFAYGREFFRAPLREYNSCAAWRRFRKFGVFMMGLGQHIRVRAAAEVLHGKNQSCRASREEQECTTPRLPQPPPHVLSPSVTALCEGMWARTLMTVRCLPPVDAPGLYQRIKSFNKNKNKNKNKDLS